MENQTETIPSQKKGGLVALAVIAAALFVAALGLGTLYFFKMEQASDLQRQVDELKTAAAKMDEEMAKDMSAKPTAPAVKYREIPELGVKYKLTGETKDLTYGYTADNEGSIEMAMFSTVELIKLQDSKNIHPCSLGSSGSIMRSIERPKVREDVAPIKKIGTYYFAYTFPQNACVATTDGEPTDEMNRSVSAVKAAYDSLEAM